MAKKLSNIKYRTEMSVTSERRALPLMLFEITELHNTDILEYVRDHYDLPRILKQNTDEYIQTIAEIEPGDDVVEYLLKEILGCIEDETGVKVEFALWLASKKAVKEFYEGNERTIYGYDTTGSVILSDLGYDGTLYGFAELPQSVDEFITEALKAKKDQYEFIMKAFSGELSKFIKKL